MTTNDKPIRLSEHDDGLLRNLYISFRIPRDQFKKRPEDSSLFEQAWWRLSGRHDTIAQLVRYMQNKQKAKRRLPVPWPTFDGAHRRSPAVSQQLDESQMEALKTVYETEVIPSALGTDAAAWNDELVEALAREFTRLTGRIVPGLLLMAIAEEKRKRGLWFKVGRHGHVGMEFGDLDEVEDRE